jgi:manganese transport protein
MTKPDVSFDPYALPSDAILEPPQSLLEAVKKIGPGIILAGTIVGSGELILTTGFGAKHGFLFLWLILFSCVIKVFIQIELGRYAIYSGKPTLGALQSISSIRFVGNFLLTWWFLMMLCTVFQLGGMLGGVAQSLNMAVPQLGVFCSDTMKLLPGEMGEFLSIRSEFPWACLVCLITVALIYRGNYQRIERVTTVLVVGVTVVTVLAATCLLFTDFAPNFSQIRDGLLFRFPDDGIGDAFAVFGITGVGATELFYYPYWCLEKGYARFVGVNDDSPEWHRRAKGWIRVMYLDAWASMIVFTLTTVAFYAMGAAVLHTQGVIPKGAGAMETLSQMYSSPFGDWTRILFLLGAGAVLFKTLYLACAANSRLTVDFLKLMGVMRVDSVAARTKHIRTFCILFPIVALSIYLFQRDPQVMVKLGGMAQAATLPMIACVAVYFRYFRISPKLKPSIVSDIFLWIAWISILVVAAYSIPDAMNTFVRSLGKPV